MRAFSPQTTELPGAAAAAAARAAAAAAVGTPPDQPSDAQRGENGVSRRPLSRTQSAPLPLGHLMLMQGGIVGVQPIAVQGAPGMEAQQTAQHQRNLLKQHIRQTVLTRASSKQQLQNQSFEEETEAAVAQEMKDSLPLSSMPIRLKIKRQYSQEAMLMDTSLPATSSDRRVASPSSREATPDSDMGTRHPPHDRDAAFLAMAGNSGVLLLQPGASGPTIVDAAVYQQLLYQVS